jgi:hypothetical protein
MSRRAVGCVVLVLLVGLVRAQEPAQPPGVQQERLQALLAKYRDEVQQLRAEAQAERDRAEKSLAQARAALEDARAVQLRAEAQAKAAQLQAEQAAGAFAEREAAQKAALARLQAELAALRQGKADGDAQQKYMRAVAESFLDGVLARDGRSLAAVLTRELRTNVVPAKEGTPEYARSLQEWIDGLNPGGGARFEAARISRETFAPGGDEAIFQGDLAGNRPAVFSLRIVKDRESGRYLVAFVVVRER